MSNHIKIRIALWGLGRHALNNILPAMHASEHIELVGICTRSAEKGEATAKAYQCEYWSSETEMLARDDVEMIYLSTPTGLHFANGMEVLRSRKHLLCEKSLTHTPDKSLELIGFARSKNLFLAEAFMYTFHPLFKKVLELTSSEAFGRILNISTYFNLPPLQQPGYRNSAELGGSALFDLGCYPISIATYLLPVAQVLWSEQFKKSQNEIFESGAAVIQAQPGQHAYVNWGYNRTYGNDLTVNGEKQSLHVERIFGKETKEVTSLTLSDVSGTKTAVSIEPANSFVQMFKSIAEQFKSPEMREYYWQMAEKQAMLMRSIDRTNYSL